MKGPYDWADYYRNKLEKQLYYPCRTYDKHGNLIKEEYREPVYFESTTQRLHSFDLWFTGHSGSDDECEGR